MGTFTYQVKQGDTVTSIASAYGLTIEDIQKDNPKIVCQEADQNEYCIDQNGLKRDHSSNFIYTDELLFLTRITNGQILKPEAPQTQPNCHSETYTTYETKTEYVTKTKHDTERRFVTEYDCGLRFMDFNFLKGEYETGYKCGLISHVKDVPVTYTETVPVTKNEPVTNTKTVCE